MSIAVQKSLFGQDKFIADCRTKLTELYHNKPETVQSEKRVIVEFWSAYDGLANLLADKWQPFVDWFMNATSSETITRCLRALKEDGTIKLNQEQQDKRRETSNTWREYWSRGRHNNGS